MTTITIGAFQFVLNQFAVESIPLIKNMLSDMESESVQIIPVPSEYVSPHAMEIICEWLKFEEARIAEVKDLRRNNMYKMQKNDFPADRVHWRDRKYMISDDTGHEYAFQYAAEQHPRDLLPVPMDEIECDALPVPRMRLRCLIPWTQNTDLCKNYLSKIICWKFDTDIVPVLEALKFLGCEEWIGPLKQSGDSLTMTETIERWYEMDARNPSRISEFEQLIYDLLELRIVGRDEKFRKDFFGKDCPEFVLQVY